MVLDVDNCLRWYLHESSEGLLLQQSQILYTNRESHVDYEGEDWKAKKECLEWLVYAFVMYYIYGVSGLSLLIESTDSI